MQIAVVLHDIRSVHNVGSIFRTADAVRAEKIYLCGITPSPLDRFRKVREDFAKVALGAEEFVPWESAVRTIDVMKKLKEEGWSLLAVEQARGSMPFFKVRAGAHSKIALIMGNEVKGLPRSVLSRADRTIEIPMLGKKESVNVGVAFGIVAFGIRFAGSRGIIGR